MSDWLKTLLGVEEGDIPPDAATSFEFANLPRGSFGLVLLLVALALLAGVFWVYRREGSVSMRAKLGLAALRALVLVCAFVLVLEPVLAIDQVEHIDKSTVVLVDASYSMTTRDRYRDMVAHAELLNFLGDDPRQQPRYRLLNDALDMSGLLSLLARNNEVKVLRFADGVIGAPQTLPRLEEGAKGAPYVPVDPTETKERGLRGTDLAGAVRQAVETTGSDRIAAIVLLTDGRNNLGPPPADLALFLRNKDLKLFTVAVGEAEPPRNLRAVALAGPERVFRKDPAVFEARIASQGYPSATVEFYRSRDAEDAGELVKTEVVAFEGGQPAVVKLTERPDEVGTIRYRVRVVREADESNDQDNEKTFTTRVVDEKARVLLVAGAPAHEYYAIKNVLLRDSTITLTCFLQSADPRFPQDGNVRIDELPGDEKGLFEYDVILLHDPDGDGLPPDWPAMLKKFVSDHRGGLCFIAGNKHTLTLVRDTRGENELTGILPVVLDFDRADSPGIGIGYGGYFAQPWRMVPEPAALSHPATRFHDDPRMAKELVWERLPPFYWFFPVLKAKPGAVVLARHEDPREVVEPYGRRPILAVHRYGGGRVMFLAADETNRWRSVAENVFDRFWVQSVRWLLEGRHAGARRRFRIYLDRELLAIGGDAVRISAEVFDERFEPLRDRESVRVEVSGPGGPETVHLLPVPGKDGHFSGSFAPTAVGDYEVRPIDEEFKPEDAPALPGATFRAELPHREMGDVRADVGLLKELAGRTRGVFAPLHRIARLGDPKLIPPASERVVTQGRPVPLWDTWTTILVMLVLVCAEWILRKRFRMV